METDDSALGERALQAPLSGGNAHEAPETQAPAESSPLSGDIGAPSCFVLS